MTRINNKSASSKRKSNNRKRPHVEALEDRVLMASSISLNSAGLLDIRGTAANDYIQVRDSGSVVSVVDGPRIVAKYAKAKVKSILFRGYAGHDRFDNRTAIRARAYGYSGNDKFWGGGGNDLLSGDSGHDFLIGRGGNDTLIGHAGNDRMFGNDGHDRFEGGLGNDTCFGGDGNDFMYGHAGNDRLYGYDGNDSIYANAGNDILVGHAGNDLLSGSDGDDRLFGYNGADRLYGNNGNDLVYGNNGNDLIFGQDGNDLLRGHHGNDRIFGHAGNDSAYGGSGDDEIQGGLGSDSLNGETGNDRVYAYDNTPWNDDETGQTRDTKSIDRLNGGAHDDTVYGDFGQDHLFGETGNDYLNGKFGDNKIYGQDGNDTLFGGAYGGDDYMEGGLGNDELYGMSGNDTLYGDNNPKFGAAGYGDDTLRGHAGDDRLIPGSGNEVTYGDDGVDTVEYDATASSGRFHLFKNSMTINGTLYKKHYDVEAATITPTTTAARSSSHLYIHAGGFQGRVTIEGGAGNDTLYGSNYNDKITGGAGADFIHGFDGHNLLIASSDGRSDGAKDIIISPDDDKADIVLLSKRGQSLLNPAEDQVDYGGIFSDTNVQYYEDIESEFTGSYRSYQVGLFSEVGIGVGYGASVGLVFTLTANGIEAYTYATHYVSVGIQEGASSGLVEAHYTGGIGVVGGWSHVASGAVSIPGTTFSVGGDVIWNESGDVIGYAHNVGVGTPSALPVEIKYVRAYTVTERLF